MRKNKQLFSVDGVMRILTQRYLEPAASSKATPWEVVLFTLLSARTRDDQTEPAFRRLVKAYPTPAKLAKAKLVDVEGHIKTIGLYKSKARHVIGLARLVVAKHHGLVPKTMEELTELPGVGRKTASCVLVYGYGIPAIAVDTHVFRIANRLGWSNEKTPEKTELALRSVIPEKHWFEMNRVMVQFGRDVCVSRKPRCWVCPVRQFCAFPKKTPQSQSK